MNTNSLAQPAHNVQPKLIPSTAWAWGFEDGAKGVTVYAGYHLFAGRKLSEYRRGWNEGRKARSH